MASNGAQAEGNRKVTHAPREHTTDPFQIRPEWVRNLPIEWARRMRAFPCEKSGEAVLATEHPEDHEILENIALLLGFEPVPVPVSAEMLDHLIEEAYFQHSGEPEAADMEGADSSPQQEEARTSSATGQDLLSSSDAGPVVGRVNQLVLEAVRKRASDIHFEPGPSGLNVRYRIDGVLVEQTRIPSDQQGPMAARIKVMASLDVAEKRLPQDGTARVRIGRRELDIRVSTLPVVDGERLVLRLLQRDQLLTQLDALGMSESMASRFRRLLEEPNGVIWVTGPTGSGKTTTLYSALQAVDREDRNILTIEDPVEYQLEGLGQMSVKPSIGLTFAAGLRHILRQDPDVVLVGETRDLETAEIVVRASLTGHLVFSTLHTNDAAGAFGRLLDMGIPAYLLASSTRAALAQRLVRTLCPACRNPVRISEQEAARLPGGSDRWTGATLYEPVGCDRCQDGYHGRTALFELLEMNEPMQQVLRPGCSLSEIRTAAASDEKTMLEDGLRKVRQGVTSLSEIRRVLGTGADIDDRR